MREARKIAFARHPRQSMTDAERSIWHHLRNRSCMVFKFRRQHAVGAYIVDFVCLERRLIVEVDGSQHAGNAGNRARDRALRAMGFRVLRFWDNAALADQRMVLAAIAAALEGPSHAAARADETRPTT